MITIDACLKLIDTEASPLRPAPVSLRATAGHVLAQAAVATEDQPAFDRSGMDGYLLRAGAPPGRYRLEPEVLPGESGGARPEPGETRRIFTGAEVPSGCGVVALEDAGETDAWVETRVAAGDCLVRRRASSIRAGTTLLTPGSIVGAGEVAILASLGIGMPTVVPWPRVLHLTTGREIVPPETQIVPPGMLRDVNGPLIAALLAGSPAVPLPHRHVDERAESLCLQAGEAGPWDVLLVSGGSSAGRYDRTRAALLDLGFEILVQRVNSRPGKPLLLARHGSQWAVGIPGNPVAHFVVFQVFVDRLLRRLAGRTPREPRPARLAAPLPGPADERETLWPVTLGPVVAGEVEATPLPWVDSGDVAALSRVDALARIAPSVRPQVSEVLPAFPCHSFFR